MLFSFLLPFSFFPVSVPVWVFFLIQEEVVFFSFQPPTRPSYISLSSNQGRLCMGSMSCDTSLLCSSMTKAAGVCVHSAQRVTHWRDHVQLMYAVNEIAFSFLAFVFAVGALQEILCPCETLKNIHSRELIKSTQPASVNNSQRDVIAFQCCLMHLYFEWQLALIQLCTLFSASFYQQPILL